MQLHCDKTHTAISNSVTLLVYTGFTLELILVSVMLPQETTFQRD